MKDLYDFFKGSVNPSTLGGFEDFCAEKDAKKCHIMEEIEAAHGEPPAGRVKETSVKLDEATDMPLLEEFIRFLDRSGARGRYIYNLIKEGEDLHCLELKDALIKHMKNEDISCPRSLIIGAFDWKNTKQGDDYWRRIHKKWVDVFKAKSAEIDKDEKEPPFLEEFIQFLYDKDIMYNYEENIVKNNEELRGLEIGEAIAGLISIKEITNPRKYILSAFNWGESDEGGNYWAKCNNKWLGAIAKLMPSDSEAYIFEDEKEYFDCDNDAEHDAKVTLRKRYIDHFFKWLDIFEYHYKEEVAAYKGFRYNNVKELDAIVREYLETKVQSPLDFIDNPIHWAATVKGHDFWGELNRKWAERLHLIGEEVEL